MTRHRHRHLALIVAVALVLSVVGPVAAGSTKWRISASPSSVNFGKIPVGQESDRVVLYFTNESKIPLLVGGWLMWWPNDGNGGNDFRVDDQAQLGLSVSCWAYQDSIVPPGATCGLAVVYFAPDEAGLHSGKLYGAFWDGVTVSQTSVSLRGTGT